MKANEWGKYIKQAQADMESKLDAADKLLQSIQARLDESETGRQQGTSVLAAINESYQQVTALIAQTNADLAQVASLRATALDPTSGIETVLAKTSALTERAETVAEKISLTGKTSTADAEKVKENLANSDNNLKIMSELKNDADALLEELQKTYHIAINTGLAGSFDERRHQIETTFVKKWSTRFGLSLGLLGVGAIAILCLSIVDNFSIGRTVFFRLSLLSPLIFYTGYAAVQYSHERRLLEKYAFKAVVAGSLESYTTLIKDVFGKTNDEKLLKFVINSMEAIYSEPHEVVGGRSLSLGFRNSKVADIVAEAKEDIINKIEKAAP